MSVKKTLSRRTQHLKKLKAAMENLLDVYSELGDLEYEELKWIMVKLEKYQTDYEKRMDATTDKISAKADQPPF